MLFRQALMALEAAGIEFTNGPQVGVRLRIVDVWAGQRTLMENG
jgi:hypothetical protein